MFSLLETVYHSFDNIAKRRRVFKVETIGDCYVYVQSCVADVDAYIGLPKCI